MFSLRALWQFFLSALLVQSALADTFTNPLKNPNGSDPFIVYVDGYYYLITTTWTDLQLTRSPTLEGLKAGENKVVWKDDNPNRCCSVWAPEIHQIDGTWYLYYTAGSSDTLDNQRAHVLKGGSNPWDAYDYLGQLTTEWGIDGTVLVVDSQNYFIWSCMEDGIQSNCIATLDTPSTIGEKHILSQPLEDWERVEAPVNEGAAPLYHDGKIWVAYSASYCWTANYSLALLTYDGAGDPLDSDSWTKSAGPLFTSANGNYGTGHNGFFTSPDGSEIWNVFHATSASEGACDSNRYTMALKVEWNEDGTPSLGEAPELSDVLEGPSGE
ncbi:glycoside hydrolase family 43 protein [Aspergillus affinis]|uniref:glycoside hydrolase family 43 protein n=1 Tax=Aspergillus affinis TaxID=1070780 RepID=UPI0022FEB16B|nr:Arabinanase/levansucrase/invertase [Aspergillus affinis]KAI9044827.1 Arabinanase/levansucrase/invertase [Aspergillus affinis]